MEKALQTMIDNMPEKTGKSLDEWIVILKKQNFAKHGEAVKFLKTDYQVTHGFANTIVTLSKKAHSPNEDMVSNQYRGKESLHPIYQKLVENIQKFGSDVNVVPKKTEVSLDKTRKFAVIRPSTKTRIDLGLKLKDKPFTDRLESSGPFGTMCTHRVKLTDIKDIDKELLGWIKEAYNLAK